MGGDGALWHTSRPICESANTADASLPCARISKTERVCVCVCARMAECWEYMVPGSHLLVYAGVTRHLYARQGLWMDGWKHACTHVVCRCVNTQEDKRTGCQMDRRTDGRKDAWHRADV
eukprot:351737-Chlamydomonas_euryale.AAC.11